MTRLSRPQGTALVSLEVADEERQRVARFGHEEVCAEIEEEMTETAVNLDVLWEALQ